MDIEKIITETQLQSGIKIRNDDPLIAAVYLNKIILEEYVYDVGQKIEESMANIAIKENTTLAKLTKIFQDSQVQKNRESERIFNQFIDNLSVKLSTLQDRPKTAPTKVKSNIMLLLGMFLSGCLVGLVGALTLMH